MKSTLNHSWISKRSPIDKKVDSRVDDGGEVGDISQLLDQFCWPGILV